MAPCVHGVVGVIVAQIAAVLEVAIVLELGLGVLLFEQLLAMQVENRIVLKMGLPQRLALTQQPVAPNWRFSWFCQQETKHIRVDDHRLVVLQAHQHVVVLKHRVPG